MNNTHIIIFQLIIYYLTKLFFFFVNGSGINHRLCIKAKPYRTIVPEKGTSKQHVFLQISPCSTN